MEPHVGSVVLYYNIRDECVSEKSREVRLDVIASENRLNDIPEPDERNLLAMPKKD